MAVSVATEGLEEATHGADAAAEAMNSAKTQSRAEHERKVADVGTDDVAKSEIGGAVGGADDVDDELRGTGAEPDDGQADDKGRDAKRRRDIRRTPNQQRTPADQEHQSDDEGNG